MSQKCCCMKCKKEVEEKTVGICPHEGCGGKTFVYSDNDFSFNEEGGVVCPCGSKEFERFMHMDFTDKYVNNYKCECGNIIGTEGYRDKEDSMNGDY